MLLRKTRLTAATLTGVLAAATVASGDSVNLPLRGKDTVTGTIRPAFDAENFLCNVPQGAAVAVSLKSKSPGVPAFQLSLEDGMGPVAGANFVAKGATVSLTQPYTLGASGSYRVRVAGDGSYDGDYELKVAWKPKTAWSATGGPLDAAGQTSFTFAAPAGSGATIDVKPAARSAFAGEIVGVTGPDGPLAIPPGTTSHLVLQRLASTGDYVVDFRNAAAAAGTWSAKAKIKLPRTAAGRTDIRDSRLTGAFGPDHTVYGSVLGPSGGTLEVTATFGPLDGTSVNVPNGVLPGPTILTVSAAPSLDVGGGNHTAGPAVEFGPSGTTFDPSGTDPSKAATITIPFDPAFFPSGTDSLVVFVRSAGGVVSAVPRPYVFGTNTVSFTTSHFSSYQAATADPRPLSGDFLVLEYGVEEQSNFEGRFTVATHRLTAGPNGADLDTDGYAVRWSDGGQQIGSSATLQQDFQYARLNVQVVDDQTVVVQDPQDPGPPLKLRRGASDDVLVGVQQPVVFLRRAAAQPTLATIAGRWHVIHYALDTRSSTMQPPVVSLEISGDVGVLTIAPDGAVTITSIRGAQSASDFPVGVWQPKTNSQIPTGLTMSASEGSVQLHSPDSSFPINFTAVLDGDVLIGRGASYGGQMPGDGPAVELFVLVRASSGAKLAPGNYFVIGAEADPVDAKTSGQSLDAYVTTLVATLAKSGVVSIAGVEDYFSHDAQGAPSQLLDSVINGPGGRFTAKPDGSYTSTDGASGAFSRGGDLFIRAEFTGGNFSLSFGTPLTPPAARSVGTKR